MLRHEFWGAYSSRISFGSRNRQSILRAPGAHQRRVQPQWCPRQAYGSAVGAGVALSSFPRRWLGPQARFEEMLLNLCSAPNRAVPPMNDTSATPNTPSPDELPALRAIVEGT